jgi:transposase InsO family protein
MSSNELHKRSKLTGKDNYGTWSVATEMALKTLKAWKIITGVTPATPDCYDDNPEALNAACKEWLLETLEEDDVTAQKITSNRKKFKKHLTGEYEQWEELNGIALSEIYNSCTQSIQLLIGKKKNAIDVWKQLESSFAVSGFASVEQDILKIHELNYSSCKSLQDFINQLTTAKERLEAQSVYLPQAYYVVQLLRGLGRPFQSWAREVRHKDLNALDFDSLCTETFNEEQSIKRDEAQSNTNRGSALAAEKGKEKGPQANKGQQDSGKTGGATSKRWKCATHKTDKHEWAECYENPNGKNFKGDKIKNEKSKDTGKDASAKVATLKLDGLPADLLIQLDQIGALQRGSASRTTGTTLTGSTTKGHIRKGDVLAAEGENGFGGALAYSWLMDSGATHSMTPHRSNYISYTRGSLLITVANGETTMAEGYGDILVDLPTTTASEPESFMLKDVWYVPELDCNLLSVPQLLTQGIATVFAGQGGALLKQSKIIAGIDLKERKFWLRTTNEISLAYQKSLIVANVVTALATKGKKLSSKTWHRRLAHLGLDNLRKLKACATGISFDDTFEGCQDCILANSTRQPRNGSTSGKATKAYEGVHTDVWGPAPIQSHRGNRYLLTITDDYTHTVKVYCMKLKSEARECFINFEKEVKLHHGKDIKWVRLDNGGEYGSAELNTYVQSKGMTFQPTVPYSPESNGVAERMNRTLMAKVRAILADTKLPAYLWDYLAEMVAYLTNRSPSAATNGITPHQKLTNELPDLSHLRIPGCRVWAHLDKAKRDSKLTERSEECRLIGYGYSTKIYRLYGLKSRRVFYSQDVIFDEGPLSWLQDTDDSMALDDYIASLPNGPDDDEPANEFPAEQSSAIYRPEVFPSSQDLLATIEEDIQQADIEAEPQVVQPRPRRAIKPTRKVRENAAAVMFTTLHAATGDTPATTVTDPTFKQAINGPDADKWWEAINREYDALVRKEVFKLVPRLKTMRVLPGKWVLKIKRDGVFKARWVVSGNRQRPGIDYTEVYAATAKSTSIRVLLALTAIHDLEAQQLDVMNAFLNAHLKETIYVEMPHGFAQKDHVCLLLKTLYGLCQSPREWYMAVATLLLQMSFRACYADNSVFVHENGVVIIVYVDDMLLFGKDKQLVATTKRQLNDAYEMRDMGDLDTYLGLKVHRDRTKRVLRVNQTDYTRKILDTYGFGDGALHRTPMDSKAIYTMNANGQADEATVKEYQSMIGSALHLAIYSRPDILYSVVKLAQFCTNPSVVHHTAVKRIYRYLRSLPDLEIIYTRDGGDQLVGYTDANWAGGNVAEDGRRSTSGFIFTLGGGPISWSSKRQHTVATSSCEAEYIGQCNATKEAVWLRLLLREIGYAPNGPTTIFADNKSAIALATNPVYHGRSRHIDIQYHYTREKVNDDTVQLLYLPTVEMVADGLTKALDQIKHRRFLDLLGLEKGNGSDWSKDDAQGDQTDEV